MGVHRHLLYVRVHVYMMCALYYIICQTQTQTANCAFLKSKPNSNSNSNLDSCAMCSTHCETPARCEGPSASAALNASLRVRQAGGCG